MEDTFKVTDPETGDTLVGVRLPGGVVNFTTLRVGVRGVTFTAHDMRELIRWLADTLGETPMLAAQPDFFRVPDADGDVYFIANHDGHSCWFCHQPILVGAFCERIVFPSIDPDMRPAPDEWAHDGCRPKPGEVVVLEVEG